MIVQYKDPKDSRITVKKSFLKEYLIVLGIVLICCAGTILLYIEFIRREMSPWVIAMDISSYVFLVCLLISLSIHYIMNTGYLKPLAEVGQAARKVAGGDFTVRIRPKRKDGLKDEFEVLIDDFNKMVEELATIETLKGDFIANISHEIKTPLAIIQSYTTLLRKEEISKEDKENYIQTVLEATNKLSDLVSNVLRLTKLENQEIIQIESFSLAEQLRLCILSLDEKFEEKNIDLEIDIDEVVINSDDSLLEIVWNNLLTNAIKYTEPGGRVKVQLKQDNETAVVTIADTGCGIDDSTFKRIFDRFYQGDTSHLVEGNGLGLSLVKRVVDLVGGQISVRSEKGNGSTFTVRLKN
ncbi:HAMP domain-containing sensor histidine kinase [Anaerotignum sp.]|uniref:HAMP domain-containing sensor histidine kinase n=1 Tax=Anaerotignum sp. TaxID=2039241 RepID=UPI0027154F4F|nr:HAMP domain-containing sensor histidine kinase [Anaerotignum sp.]